MSAVAGNHDKTTDINSGTVLGTGVLGSEIAYQTAFCGLPVTAYDISDEILQAATRKFEAVATRFEKEVEGASGRAGARPPVVMAVGACNGPTERSPAYRLL